jgi:transposase-like protein
MSAFVAVACPACLDIEKVVKFGRTGQGKQRYLCRQEICKKKTFILDHTNKGFLPGIKKHIIEMTLNGSGIRDIARVLGIAKGTVISEIKKRKYAQSS